MAYKYATLVPYEISSGSVILNEFQASVNQEFFNSPTAHTILEESPFGSGSFVNTDVRITGLVNQETGVNLGDDWKHLAFKDVKHSISLGTKYYFDGNYYLAVNTEVRKSIAASVGVRRCNNQLRWMDENGVFQSEPCIIDYKLSRPRDLVGTENLPLPQGFIEVFAQGTSKTFKIQGNQRFIFGPIENRIAYKIFGDGIKNFLNQSTMDDQSPKLLTFSMGGNFVNPDLDNITLGVADYYKNYSNLTSGSLVGAFSIVSTPNTNYILQSGSALYDVRYYSGSVVQSGSFVFSVSGSMVPTSKYVFAQESNNTFSIYNLEAYPNYNLNILCSGSSGSRVLELELRGVF